MKTCCVLMLICACLTLTAGKYQNGIPQSTEADKGKVDVTKAPAKDKPWIAAWGHFPNHPGAWYNIHKSYVERSKKGNVDTVFIGDSITMGWNQNKETFHKNFGDKAVNYGIGGDTTRQILWRIDNGMLDGISPKLVVLKIGTNNLYNDFNSGSDKEIAKGIKAVVAKLQSKLPEAKIILLGILPRQNEYFSGRILKINKQIKELGDSKTIYYFDMGNHFIEKFGVMKKELFTKDKLHLGPEGYKLWAKLMKPMYDKLMK
ncbi:MAG: GDSL-type esterase/lipase family protein [Lentisphaeraceae bacterium]|nr:GDSL-type esterase/lipase family protein [Lentisphaeraceae bacterium]